MNICRKNKSKYFNMPKELVNLFNNISEEKESLLKDIILFLKLWDTEK